MGGKLKQLFLYRAREENRVVVVRRPLWHWGNALKFSSLLCPMLGYAKILPWQETSVLGIGEPPHQSSVLARSLNFLCS